MRIRHCASVAALAALNSFGSTGAIAGNADAQVAAADRSPTLVEVIRRNTLRFHDIDAAEAEHYGLFLGCVNGHDGGAMGIHYVNGDYVGDPGLDPERPEALIYEQRNGRLHLIAVEFIVDAATWDAANESAPVLMGQVFEYSDAPNRYRLAPFYELHVWAWKENSDGMFADFNPDVSCENYVQ